MSKDFYYQAARDQYEVLQAAQHRTLATLEECRVEGIKDELVVGITGEMKQAIEVVCSFQGLKPQQGTGGDERRGSSRPKDAVKAKAANAG